MAKSLSPLKERWKEVGSLFKLTNLEDIETKYKGNHENCLREIVDKWLNEPGCNSTWQLLADTVAVLDTNVSDAIASKHPAGILSLDCIAVTHVYSAGEDEKPHLNDLMNAVAVKISNQWMNVRKTSYKTSTE